MCLHGKTLNMLFINKVTATVIEIANNLVDLTEEANDEDGSADASAEHYADILLAIEQQVNRTTASGQNLTTVEPNIALTITTVMPNQPAGFSFAVLSSDGEEFNEQDIRTYNDPDDIPNDSRTSVSLPSAIFDTSGNGKKHIVILIQPFDTRSVLCTFKCSSRELIIKGKLHLYLKISMCCVLSENYQHFKKKCLHLKANCQRNSIVTLEC